jgi:ribosomal protein S26
MNECKHEVDYVGEQKGEKGPVRYFRCKKCGSMIIRDDDGKKYEIKNQDDAKEDSSPG